MADDLRRTRLVGNLAVVETRLLVACAAAGRPREEVTLVAVTKTFPATDCEALRELGVLDLGENRDREAADKARTVSGVRWHFVGQLQSNKARGVASYAHLVHAVDRVSVAAALGAGAVAAERVVGALVQVRLDADPARGGALPEQVPRVADAVAGTPGLRLDGVMAVAPLGLDPDLAFARLAEVAAALRADHPAARAISAGMSGDLEQAIRHGATYVRVGSAILGGRGVPLG